MEIETECSICLLSYTSVGAHRMTSLKCGHCFGYYCIAQWIEMNKKSVCPVCSKTCKLSHLREIYAVRTVSRSHMAEEDLIEKYLNEAKKVRIQEEAIVELRNKLDLLRMSTRQAEPGQQNSDFVLFTSKKDFIKTTIALPESLIEFDISLNFLIITYIKQGVPGFYKYTFGDKNNEFIPFRYKITDIKPTPHFDGLVLVSSNKEVFLIYLWNNRIIYKSEFDRQITAVSFHPSFQNIIYVGDDIGNIYHINMLIDEVKSIKALKTRVHSLCAIKHHLYAASVFGIVRLEHDSLRFSQDQVFSQALEGSVCVQADTSLSEVLFVFRDKELTVSCLYIDGDIEHLFYPNIKQEERVSNRIFGGCAYILDGITNSIRVINVKTFNIVHTYNFKEKVINFVATEKGFTALTVEGIYLYG